MAAVIDRNIRRSQAVALDRDAVLAEVRDAVARRFREAMRAVFAKAGKELLALGEASDDADHRIFLYGIREALLERGARLEGLLSVHWLERFEATIGRGGRRTDAPGWASKPYTLVPKTAGDSDEDAAVHALADRLCDACEQELLVAGRRLALLAGVSGVLVVEDILIGALRSALVACEFSPAQRIELLRGLGHHIVEHLVPVVRDMNAYFVAHHVLPELGGTAHPAQAPSAAQVAPAPAAQPAPAAKPAPAVKPARQAAEIDQAVAQWLAAPLPAAVADLLRHEWRTLLQKSIQDDVTWNATLATARDLLAVVRAAEGSAERDTVLAGLSSVVKRIDAGLDVLGVGNERRIALFDALLALAMPKAGPAQQAPAPGPAAGGQAAFSNVVLDFVGAVADPRERVMALKRGDRVRIDRAEGGAGIYRVSWISPQRATYLLTSPASTQALALTPVDLVARIERGEAELLD